MEQQFIKAPVIDLASGQIIESEGEEIMASRKVLKMAENDDFQSELVPVPTPGGKFGSVWDELETSLQESFDDLQFEAAEIKKLARADVDLMRDSRKKMEIAHNLKREKLSQEVGS